MKEISISILGTCCERDAFTLSEQYYYPNNKYNIASFVQSQSIHSIYSRPCFQDLELKADEFTKGADFLIRCMLINFNKSTWEHIDSNVDYFIIGIANSRFELMEFDDYKGCLIDNDYFTYCNIKDHPKTKNLEFKSTKPTDLQNTEFEIALTKFIKDVKKRFKNRQIIINEVYLADSYISPLTGKIVMFEDLERILEINEWLSKVFKSLKRSFPKAIIIEMPKGAIGNAKHKWGKNALHFVDVYYVYLMMSVDAICSEGVKNKRQELNRLRKLAETAMSQMRLYLS